MPRIEIPFCGPAYKSKNLFLSGQECVNYFLDAVPDIKKAQRPILRGAPGLTEWCDLGTDAPVKGMLAYQDWLYAVSGSTLFKVTFGATATTIGNVILTEPKVSLITNGLQVGLFGGEKGYYYTIATDTLAEITAALFQGGPTATYQDGYAFINPYDTAQVHRCELNDFSDWQGEFSTAGWKADNLQAVLSHQKDVWCLGEQTIEPFFNTGQSGFGFARRDGAEMMIGLSAVHSPAILDNAIFWLGEDENGPGQIFQAINYQPRVISPTAIVEAVNSYSTISDAIGFSYQIDNHPFYEISFPTAETSWIYDSLTQQWHERQSYRTVHLVQTLLRHRVQCHVYFAGKHLVGDIENGKIYEMSRDYFDEDGTEMPAIRTSMAMNNNQDLITVNEWQVLFIPGQGLVSGQGSDPLAMLSFSKDGGRTFSNEREVHMGKIGEYERRATTWQLGQGRNWVFRSKVTDAVNRDIMGSFGLAETDDA